MSGRSLQHLGPADFHDGHILSVERPAPDRMRVQVRGFSGQRYNVDFHGVEEVVADRAVGMMLYALSELPAPGESRRFVFTNWDEEDPARLEVLAREIGVHGSA